MPWQGVQKGCSRAGRCPWVSVRPSHLPLHSHSAGSYGTRSDLRKTRQRSDPSGGRKRGERKPVYFSFCYFISLQWEQLKMSRINENNCWASVQVVKKEPQTLLSPTTKRCWHNKNSIFLCRNHLLNSLVLNITPCLLPLLPPCFKNKSHKKIISPPPCYIRCFLRSTVLSSTCDISLRFCLRWLLLKTQYDSPSPPKIMCFSGVGVKCQVR